MFNHCCTPETNVLYINYNLNKYKLRFPNSLFNPCCIPTEFFHLLNSVIESSHIPLKVNKRFIYSKVFGFLSKYIHII